MVAYSFKPRFVDPILSGIKSGTIRANGLRRHAIGGEQLQLYTGMRTKNCKLILKIVCFGSSGIVLEFSPKERVTISGEGEIVGAPALNTFARLDGFPDFAAMREFWREEHDVKMFLGTWIRWTPKRRYEIGETA